MPKKEAKFCPWCGGLLEKKFIQGKERLVCTLCSEIYYKNPLPAATALVLNQDNQLLLGLRAIEPARGMWCLPGGFIEMGETMEQAALRELKEETCIEGKVMSFVGCFYQESRFYGGVIIFGYRIEPVCGEPKAGDDVEEVFFYSLDDLPVLAFEAHRKLVEKLKKQLNL